MLELNFRENLWFLRGTKNIIFFPHYPWNRWQRKQVENLSTISLKPKLCRGNSRFITKSHNWVDLTHLPRLRPPNMQTWGPNPLASIWRCDMLWLYTVDGQFSACLDLWKGMKTLQTTGKKHGSHYIPIANGGFETTGFCPLISWKNLQLQGLQGTNWTNCA